MLPNATMQERRTNLAQFLRSRRERLQPAQLGIPAYGRRRTPGLRREEVAQLAGVGVAWYTWLEQGRDIRVSADVLEGLARALQLNADERAYLYLLAREEVPAVRPPAPHGVPGHVQALMDALPTVPTYALDMAGWNVVAWNRAAQVVFADFAALPAAERNLLRFVLAHPSQRTLLMDWETEAQQAIALFRANTVRYVGEPWHTALIDDLTRTVPQFAAWWARNDLQGAHEHAKRLCHPTLGELCVTPTILQVTPTPTLQVVAYVPADERTAEQFAALPTL